MFALAVDFICDHPLLWTISFVGSKYVQKYIYLRGYANGTPTRKTKVELVIHESD